MQHKKTTVENQSSGNRNLNFAARPDLPASRSAVRILELQRLIDNQGVERLIQLKPKAGALSLSHAGPGIQPFPANHDSASQMTIAPPATAAESNQAIEAPARPLIMEDDAEQLQPGQMRKSEFLDQLHSSVCGATEEALAGTMWSAMGCPYIDRWFGHYSGQSSEHIERALHKYAPETAGASSARDYIPIITQRLRRGIGQWRETGEVTGVPEELRQGATPGVTAAGLMGGLAGGALSAVGGAISGLASGAGRALSGMGQMLFKGREGGARKAESPAEVQSQLGSGRSLDGGVKARMEEAYGMNFSGVRIHTDAKAHELSDSLNARAFTVGNDIAFGPEEYRPGTLIGDALIAHELAHVAQQGGGSASAAPQRKEKANDTSLEEAADVAAAGAVASIWGGTEGALTDIGKSRLSGFSSGLRLQRCGGGPALPANVGMSPPRNEPAVAPGPHKPVLDEFAAKFPDSADLIRKSPDAMKLIAEADAARVIFGGYSEESPDKSSWAYTRVKTVYVPKTPPDKVRAMADFLFELNNAIRQPRTDAIADKAIADKITAKKFAREKVEIEVEGMLRLGPIYIEMKESEGGIWDQYEDEFYFSHYQAVKSGKKTREQLIDEVLQWTNGKDPAKTNEQYYMDQYYRYKKFQSDRP